MAEKGLRKVGAYLIEHLKLGSVERYAWIQGKEIMVNILAKAG